MISIGFIFKKLSSMSGLGAIDRILGFAVGASKFFLIAAVISYSVYSVKAVKTTVDSVMKNSILFPILVETGGYIMKIDSGEMIDNIDKNTKSMQNKIKDSINDSTLDIVKDTKEQINKQIENQLDEQTEQINKQINERMRQQAEQINKIKSTSKEN